MQRISSCVFVVSSLLLAAISPAMAAFPERAITLVVPFAAGGPTDALARLLGQRMSEVIKQPIIIENVGGAGSMLGTARAAKAPPDGYTILINDLALPSAPYLRKSLPINVRTDLTPIGLINAGPLILIARKSMRADTAAQMFALFKAEQTNIKFGHGGTGTNSHMCGLLIQQALGVTFTSVPYRGTGPAMNDLLGGTLDTLCEQSQTALPQVLGDKVTAYGVTSTARIISIPNVPTLAEAGLTGFDFLVWHGLYAPKGTPDTIVEALNRVLNSSLDDPTIRQRYVEMGRIEFPLDQRTPAAHKARLNSEIDRLGKLLEAAGIKPEE